MTVQKPRLPDCLDHILEAIGRIRTYTEDMVETAFLENTLVQDGVIRNIEVIGEAAKNVEQRAKRGSLAKFRAALARVPDVEPAEYDRLKYTLTLPFWRDLIRRFIMRPSEALLAPHLDTVNDYRVILLT